MANIIKPKRSNTAGLTPTTTNLASGELGVNMADQKTYINNGTSVVQIGAGKLSGLADVAISSPSNGQSLQYNGTSWINVTGAGSGTVTSVGLSMPTGFSVSGSPVTSSGTLAVSTALNGSIQGNGSGFTAISNTGSGDNVLSVRPTMSVTGSGFTLQDATDNTKQANFVLSGLTTGTTYSYALPAVSGSTLAALSGNQTFTGTQTYNAGMNLVSTASNINIGTGLTTGTMVIGGTGTTTNLTIGQSTVSQTTNIQAGATASGSTKTINIGTNGLSGSTTAITIGSTNGTTATAYGAWTFNTPLAATNMTQATTSTSGYLSSTDWNTFNGKWSSGTALSATTGSFSGVVTSTVVTGTAPLTIASTTLNTNLNADLLDGNHASAFYLASNPSGYTSNTGTVTSVSGTAPISVATGTTTPVVSLASGYGDSQNPYASKTANYVLAAPNGVAGAPTFRALVAADIPTLNQNTTGSSGSCTGNSATATTATTATNQSGGTVAATTGSFSGVITSTLASGTAPFTLTSTTLNTNLNADLLDGQHGSYYQPASTAITTSNIGSQSVSSASTATTATTATTANALNTANNYQVNSLGVGTAASAVAGEIRATNNVTAYYASDKKWKENIKEVSNALDIVCAIGSKTFDWTDAYLEAHGGEDEYFLPKQSFGVIAQDVQQVFPQAVRIREDGTLAVDYEKLAILSFGAIGELVKRIEKLESK